MQVDQDQLEEREIEVDQVVQEVQDLLEDLDPPVVLEDQEGLEDPADLEQLDLLDLVDLEDPLDSQA